MERLIDGRLFRVSECGPVSSVADLRIVYTRYGVQVVAIGRSAHGGPGISGQLFLFFHERPQQAAVCAMCYVQAMGSRISGVEASHVVGRRFFGGEKGGGDYPFPASSPSLLLYILV